MIDSELDRRQERLSMAQKNDVWKYRSEPPEDWLKPLPNWFTEQNKYSYLSRKQKKREIEDNKWSND